MRARCATHRHTHHPNHPKDITFRDRRRWHGQESLLPHPWAAQASTTWHEEQRRKRGEGREEGGARREERGERREERGERHIDREKERERQRERDRERERHACEIQIIPPCFGGVLNDENDGSWTVYTYIYLYIYIKMQGLDSRID